MMFNQWFKKEKPLPSFASFGGGTGGLSASSGQAWEPSGITATGGTMHTGQANPDGTPYTWHVFPGGPRGPESPTPYTFSVTGVTGPGKIEYIVMAGGGMGGISPNPDPNGNYGGAGGGGAGGLICNFQSPPAQSVTTYHPKYPVSPGAMTVSASPGSYAIEVGRAAAGAPAPERNGKNSTFNGLTAVGGGAGARSGDPPGLDAQQGGSAGGGSANSAGGQNPSSPTQGGGGGNGSGSGGAANGAGGGGGGAAADGEPYSDNGDGGAGALFDDAGFFKLSVGGITDNPTQPGYRYLAGGGGGGGSENAPTNPPGTGGFGGGGDSGNPNANGGNADNWSGGGGGAGGGGDQTRNGGQGGQGMVFIRYVAD